MMQPFQMFRGHDETGVSGTGLVVEGVVFSNGITVASWVGEMSSQNIYRNFYEFYQIHVGSHPTNKTEIRFTLPTYNKLSKNPNDVCKICNHSFGTHPPSTEDNCQIGCLGDRIKLV